MHELTAPLRHGSVRYIVQNVPPGNVVQSSDGTSKVDPAVKPGWNYLITANGEILVAAEDFGWIKHTSLAAGQHVYSAGQIGVEGGLLRFSGYAIRSLYTQKLCT